MNLWLTAVLRWVGILMYTLHLHPLVIWLARRRPRVIAFHACDDPETAWTLGLQVNTPPGALARQLDFLMRYYRVVPLADLEQGTLPGRAVVITFDDGFYSVYRHAFPLLRDRGLPATIYLVTDVVGNTASIWANELNWMLRTHPATAVPLAGRLLCGTPDVSARAIMQRALVDYDRSRVTEALNAIRRALDIEPGGMYRQARLFLNWEEIDEMAGHGITFGNHTASHPNLARLDGAGQRDEIGRAADALQGRRGITTSLAYPFGRHDDSARAVAVSLGCSSIMEIGGSNVRLDRFRVARVPMAARTTGAFFAEMELVEPIKAQIKRWLGR